jgi:hypothetical protein
MSKTPRNAVWFPNDPETVEKCEQLCRLIESELNLKQRVYKYSAIIIAIEEAIERRLKNLSPL